LAVTRREQEKLKKVAYHEAEHAIAAFVMNKRFKKV
jgi:ATP-dependent Zn protease